MESERPALLATAVLNKLGYHFLNPACWGVHRPVFRSLERGRWMLEIGTFFMRTETELIIKSRRVVPQRLTAAGFEFQFPNLARAVEDLELRLLAPARPTGALLG